MIELEERLWLVVKRQERLLVLLENVATLLAESTPAKQRRDSLNRLRDENVKLRAKLRTAKMQNKELTDALNA